MSKALSSLIIQKYSENPRYFLIQLVDYEHEPECETGYLTVLNPK